MQNDTTGPATVHEGKSLLVMVGLITCVAGGIGAALYLNPTPAKQVASTQVVKSSPPPMETPVRPTRPVAVAPTTSRTPTTVRASTPTSAPSTARSVLVEGFNRLPNGSGAVRTGSLVVTFVERNSQLVISRTVAKDDPKALEEWTISNVIVKALNDTVTAEQLGINDAQAVKLEKLKLSPLSLSKRQTRLLQALYETFENSEEGTPRTTAERALVGAVKDTGMSSEEKKAFDEKIHTVREILSEEQLERIHVIASGKKVTTAPATGTAPSTGPSTSTKPVASPTTKAAAIPSTRPTTTSAPAATVPAVIVDPMQP